MNWIEKVRLKMLQRYLLLAGIIHLGWSVDDNGLLITLQNRVYIVGSDAIFRCHIVKNITYGLIDGPEKIDWSFIPVGSNTSTVLLRSGEKNSTRFVSYHDPEKGTSDSGSEIKYHREVWLDMTIHDVTADDAGTYTCTLVEYQQSASAQLYIVDTGPVCTMSNDGPIYYEGDNVTLTCTMGFHGHPKPKLDWSLPKLHVDYEHMRIQQDNTLVMVSSSVSIRLQHMIDGKLFHCVASFVNISHTYQCESMFPPESVQYAPFITHMKTYPYTEDHNHHAAAGSNLTMSCSAHGNPQPQWTWKLVSKQGKPLKILPCDSAVCRLVRLRQSDMGSYQCIVSNTIKGKLQSATQTLYLKINDGDTGYISTSGLPEITEYKKEKSLSPYAVGAIVCASLAVILIIVFILLAMKMRRRESRLHERLTRMHDENLDDQEVELLDENIQPDISELPAEYGGLKQQWEIARKDIRLVDLIAKGSFVEVWRGRMRKYPRRNEIMKVAIKRIVSEATEKERRFFLAELEVMKAIQPHPNIVPLIACYTGSDPWLVMVEFAVDGSLYQYLQHHRPGDLRVEISSDSRESVSLRNQTLTGHKLLSIATQVVCGLQHINRFKMIFYRLRASSVLVCKGGVCKLSGFGFTQDITERNLYESNSSPLRWMSPECLFDNIFNVKTNVWSFGILLWEVMHFGHLPYPDMGPHEVTEKIQTGYRMSQPPHCSSDIYNLMLMCWAENPENRPGFSDIMENLQHLAAHADKHINLDKLPEGLRSSDIIENQETVA